MTWYIKDVFFACRDCRVLQPVVLSDPAQHDPPAEPNASDGFIAVHAAHQTTLLVRQSFATASDRPLWDPLATLTFQATDGEHQYVVTAHRESIEDPRVYHFTPGSLEAHNSEVVVDDGDLRRALDLQFFPHALRPTKVERFISVVHDVVRHISPDNLEIAFDIADDPAVSVARLPTESYQELLTRCTEIFDPSEWPRVSRFLHDNRGEDGLLALRVRRHVSVVTG